MKRLVLAVLVLAFAGGSSGSVRAVAPSTRPEVPVLTERAGTASLCPWLAARAADLRGLSSPAGGSCPARPETAGRCPARSGPDRVRECPRGSGRSLSAPSNLRAAGGGVV